MMLIKKRAALKIECFISTIRIYVQFIISTLNSLMLLPFDMNECNLPFDNF